MTTQLDSGPGVAGYQSTLYSVTVNNSATYCYGSSRAAEYAVPDYWSGGETVEVSWARFGTDQIVTVKVTRTSGTISSAVVYPRRLFDGKYTVAGNTVTITMGPRDKCVVVTNGVRKERLYICADLLDAGPGDADIDIYDGTQVTTTAGRTLVFEAGFHDITADAWGDKLFPVVSSSRIYLARGAVVKGSFDFVVNPTTLASGVTVFGPGNLVGTYSTPEIVELLPGGFAEWALYSVFYGYLAGLGGTNNVLAGVTLFRYPFHSMSIALFNTILDVGFFAPWTDRSDGPKAWGGNNTYEIGHCVTWVGDDALVLESWMQNGLVHDNLLSTAGSGVFTCGYQQDFADFGYETTVQNNFIVTCNDYYLETNGQTGGEIIKIWADGDRGSDIGRYHLVFDGLEIDGDTMNSVLFHIGNKVYPFSDGAPRDGWGIVADITIKNVRTQAVPAQRSILAALDSTNAPNGVALENIEFAGVKLSVRNAADYLTVDEKAYNVTIDGASL